VYTSLPYVIYARPPDSSRCDHPNNIGWWVQIIKFLMYFFSFHCYLVTLRHKYFNTLFLNTLRPHSSCNVSDQISHPYNTTDKIIVLCILIPKLLDSEL
jgi:hypothetical protein